MKIYTLFTLAFAIHIFSAEDLCSIGYDSTYTLTIKQKFAIPEDVRTGDFAGTWKKTYTWKSGNIIKYAIKKNYHSAFSINDTTGIITISDANKINGKIVQQDTVVNLIIRTSDSKLGYEDDTCQIYIKESRYCLFIDYTFIGNKKGTRKNPHNNFPVLELKAGYGYFIKRGNTINKMSYKISGVKASAKHPLIISAYSSGNNPIFDGKDLAKGNEAFCFSNVPFPTRYCYIFNIDIKNYPSMAFRINTRSSNFGIYNCNFYNNIHTDYKADLGDIYFFGTADDTLVNWNHELINLESEGSYGPIVKTDASGINAYNIKSSAANVPLYRTYNFRFAISYNSRLRHFWFIGGTRSLQIRYPNNEITDGILTDSYDGAILLANHKAYGGYPNNTLINNVLFRSNGYGVLVYDSDINNTQIKNCRFEKNHLDGIHFRNNGNNRTIETSSFINNRNGIEILSQSKTSENTTIRFNLFYGNTNKAINASNKMCVNKLNIINNTILGMTDLSGSAGIVIQNNFFTAVKGSTLNSSNIVLDSFSLNKYFKDPNKYDFRVITSPTRKNIEQYRGDSKEAFYIGALDYEL